MTKIVDRDIEKRLTKYIARLKELEVKTDLTPNKYHIIAIM